MSSKSVQPSLPILTARQIQDQKNESRPPTRTTLLTSVGSRVLGHVNNQDLYCAMLDNVGCFIWRRCFSTCSVGSFWNDSSYDLR